MKKFFSIVMAMAMMVSCLVGFALNSSAAPAFVQETYEFVDVREEFGQTPNEDGVLTEPALLGGLWGFEYYSVADREFKPMGVYWDKSHADEGWIHGDWEQFYGASYEGAWEGGDTYYCAIAMQGERVHPGPGANPVFSFTAPATGVISLYASVYSYNAYTPTEDNPNRFLAASVYVNDDLVWPENLEEGHFTAETNTVDSPFEIKADSFSVNEGDIVRLQLGLNVGNADNGGAGMFMVNFPEITYHSASVPIGDPNGTPPAEVTYEERTSEGCTLKWTAASKAQGYNVYVNGEKVNTEIVTDTTYKLTGLEPKTTYTVTITTVTPEGNESVPSDELAFRTTKADSNASASDTATTDTATTDTTDATDTAGAVSTAPSNATQSNKPATSSNVKEEDSSAWIWIVVAIVAVVVIAAVVVAVLLLGKKKAVAAPAEDADAAAEAPAEEAEAPAEEAEVPAEEAEAPAEDNKEE